jgi:hypothetical protein
MAFITDKEELKSGLIIFRRGDVTHRNFYCRVKMPKDDRYKTIALGTSNPESARELAIEKEAEIRVLLKHDHPVFNRSFRKVSEEYLAVQQRRADTGEISVARVKNLKNVLFGALDRYVGSAQIHLVGQDRWAQYPTWRRENGKGRHRDHISDSTIDFEMGAFNAAMNFAIRKRYVPANQRFEGNGEVAFHEGYLTEREAKRIAKGEAPEATTKQARPEITAAMTSYIDLHRHAAVRSALAANTGVALRVMVAHAICGSPLWRVEVQSQRSRNDAVTESVEASVAEARFDERRRAVLGVLGFDPDEPSVTLGHEPRNGVSGLFQRLLELPDAVVMEVLGVVMAETLASGTGLIETIGLHLNVKMADYWVADDAFFGLIRDREVLTEVLREVGGDTVAQAHAAEKGKTVKGVIADYLTGRNGRNKVEQWVPRWMAFPPSAYTQRGGVATVAAANRAAWLAEPEVPLDPDPAAAGAAEVAESGEAETADALEEIEEQRLAA